MMKVITFIVFLIFCSGTKNEEIPDPYYGQNLYPHIKTEVIDLPDNTNGNVNTVLGGAEQYGLRNEVTSNPLYQPQVDVTGNQVKNNLHQEKQNIPTNNAQNLDKQQLSPTNYPYVNPYPYYNGMNSYLPFNPIYQYPQYFHNQYQYQPFYPGSYVQYRYPYLHNQFPNGLYILPDAANVPNSPEMTTQKRVDTITDAPPADTSSSADNIGRNVAISQISKPQYTYSNLGERKIYTSNIKLSPVSTVLTRYTGSDGKTHVKVVTSDGSGNKKELSSEHDGPINLKIINGVLEEPQKLNRTINTSERRRNQNVDPNSILQQKLTTAEEVQTTVAPEETGEPVDLFSWNP